MKRIRLPRQQFLVLAAVGLVVVGAAVVTVVSGSKDSARHGDGHDHQHNFSYTCTDTEPDSMGCLQQKYATMTRDTGVDATFAELKPVYASSANVKSNCHQITHAIGREAAEIYKTVEAAYDHGDNLCWSGYYHGVMESIVKDVGVENINNSVPDICKSVATNKPQSFYHFNCVHGVGHGLMAINDDELFVALQLCDKYTNDWEQQSCQGGVFMENVMANVNSGTTKYLRDDQPMYPCTAVENRYKQQCYLMQTSRALQVVKGDYDTVFELCSEAGTYETTCYESLGRDASGNSSSNVTATLFVCNKGTTQIAQDHCYIGAVKDYISYYHDDVQATALCNAAPVGSQAICTQTKQSYYQAL